MARFYISKLWMDIVSNDLGVSEINRIYPRHLGSPTPPGRALRHYLLWGGFGLPPTPTYQLLVVGVSREGDMWGQGSKIYSSEPAICYEPLTISLSDATRGSGASGENWFGSTPGHTARMGVEDPFGSGVDIFNKGG